MYVIYIDVQIYRYTHYMCGFLTFQCLRVCLPGCQACCLASCLAFLPVCLSVGLSDGWLGGWVGGRAGGQVRWGSVRRCGGEGEGGGMVHL